ncbi:MAG: hypothetical protein ACKOZU_06770 [Planctomycetaceae bacterium]
MAGIAVPDQLRPALAAAAKHHFWILAALVPLVLVPLLFVGSADLRARIAAQRRQIESKVGQARAVTAVQPHPNEGWRVAIDSDAESVRRETLDEGRRFWHGQTGFRVWPAELGDAFLDDVVKLKPGGKLDRTSLVRYQNVAPRLVRALPKRMGVEDAMAEQPRDGTLTNLSRPATAALAPPLAWSAASQKRLYDSFVWTRVPNTTQVVLAQEELWVYGLFCDLLAGFVKGATGAHDSALTLVDELSVGFPANADPAQAQQRILLPKAAEGAPEGRLPGMMELPPGPGPGAGGVAQTPWNPRFTGGGPAEPRPEFQTAPGEQPATSGEDAYRGWVYVDLAGRPLSAADLAAAPDMQMVHLMPFVLRVVVDQRQIDRLLTTLAASSIPIDVRQVRVNPGAGGGDGGGAGAVPGMRELPTGPGAAPTTRRPNDVLVEIRGSVALATRPPTAAAPEATP